MIIERKLKRRPRNTPRATTSFSVLGREETSKKIRIAKPGKGLLFGEPDGKGKKACSEKERTQGKILRVGEIGGSYPRPMKREPTGGTPALESSGLKESVGEEITGGQGRGGAQKE